MKHKVKKVFRGLTFQDTAIFALIVAVIGVVLQKAVGIDLWLYLIGPAFLTAVTCFFTSLAGGKEVWRWN